MKNIIYLSFVSRGNSIPSRNPRVANISPGFPSQSVKHRVEGTTDDSTGTGLYANDKPSPNTSSQQVPKLKGTANHKGLLNFISCKL